MKHRTLRHAFLVILPLSTVLVYLSTKLNIGLIGSRSWPTWKDDTLTRKNLTGHNTSVQTDKWIVVTTIFYPTPDVKFLARIPGWQLLVVGDTKTPKNWSLPGSIYLSVEDQQNLGLQTVSHVPLRSYTRMNIGYLFAISHGAKVIYETDDDNRPNDQLKNFVLKPSMWTLAFDGKELFNPYRYFGQPTLWPRGYPLSAVGKNTTSDYLLDNYQTPLIQQGVVNGDPDMDAIFRLTRKQTTSRLNVTFDGRAPPVIVPNGALSPFNSQNTLFLYDALWALLLPVTTTQRVCDIWRGYWSQRLMWEIGGHLGFFPPNAFQKRNAHSYLQDAVEEKALYFETERLVSFLQKWTCDVSFSFFKCVIQLTTDMTSEGFVEKQDVLLVESWIEDLKLIGYKEPTRKSFQRFHSLSKVLLRHHASSGQRSKVKFEAAAQIPPSIYPNDYMTPLLKKLIKMSKFCKDSELSLQMNTLQERVKIYPNILLIIVFNFPYYKNIHFLEALYRMHFPNILYCGGSKKEFDKQIGDTETVSFIEVGVQRGYIAHKCLTKAMRMNYKVDGYLYMGDDVLLNVWNMHEQPLDKLWVKACGILQLSVQSKWYWYRTAFGRNAYLASVEALRRTNSTRVVKFEKYLQKVTGSSDGFCRNLSDIAYVPEKYKTDVLFFFEYFPKVFVEIVFPTVFYGLESVENLYVMPGTYLRFGAREKYRELFNKSELFSHGIKLSKELYNKEGHDFFCKTVLPLTLH